MFIKSWAKLFSFKSFKPIGIDFLEKQDGDPATEGQRRAIERFGLVLTSNLNKETASFIIHTLKYVHAVKSRLGYGSLKGKPYYYILRSFYQEPILKEKMDKMNRRRWQQGSEDFRPRKDSVGFIVTSAIIQFAIKASEESEGTDAKLSIDWPKEDFKF